MSFEKTEKTRLHLESFEKIKRKHKVRKNFLLGPQEEFKKKMFIRIFIQSINDYRCKARDGFQCCFVTLSSFIHSFTLVIYVSSLNFKSISFYMSFMKLLLVTVAFWLLETLHT